MSVLTKYNMIESMVLSGISKRNIERRLAEMSLGIVGALRGSRISPQEAYYDLFNLDTYQSIKRHRLSLNLKKLFQWGMEIEDVAEIAPKGLEESYRAIEQLAQAVLAKSAEEGEKLNKNRFPKGWDERRVRRVIQQSENEIAAIRSSARR